MNKEVFDSIVQKANGSPFIVYGDNMMLFSVGFDQNYYVQDDECVYCIRVNKTPGGTVGVSQQESPYEIVAFDYDMIQYVKIFPSRQVICDILESGIPMGTDMDISAMKNEIMSSTLFSVTSPRGYTGSDPTVNNYGQFTGVEVSMGEPPKYLKKIQEDFNNLHKE